ncbi:MAG: hypothetical protein ACLFR0_07090, partial [Alphaproteobacteria bacterium]
MRFSFLSKRLLVIAALFCVFDDGLPAYAQDTATPAARPNARVFTQGAILPGQFGGGSQQLSPRAVQVFVVHALRKGDFATAKALMRTQGGQTILKAVPDFEQRVSRYIEAAIQKEMMDARYLNTDDLQRALNGELYEIASLGNDRIQKAYLEQLTPENIQKRINASLKAMLQEQMKDVARTAITEKKKAELEERVRQRLQEMDKEELRAHILGRFSNMSDLEKEQFLKKQINKVIKERIRESLQEEMNKLEGTEFMQSIQDGLKNVTTPVAEGISERNVKIAMGIMMQSDGKIAEMFGALDDQIAGDIFMAFDENTLGRFVNTLGLEQSPLAAKEELAGAVAGADPKALEMLVKNMDDGQKLVFTQAMMKSDLGSYLEKTLRDKIKKMVLEKYASPSSAN